MQQGRGHAGGMCVVWLDAPSTPLRGIHGPAPTTDLTSSPCSHSQLQREPRVPHRHCAFDGLVCFDYSALATLADQPLLNGSYLPAAPPHV